MYVIELDRMLFKYLDRSIVKIKTFPFRLDLKLVRKILEKKYFITFLSIPHCLLSTHKTQKKIFGG